MRGMTSSSNNPKLSGYKQIKENKILKCWARQSISVAGNGSDSMTYFDMLVRTEYDQTKTRPLTPKLLAPLRNFPSMILLDLGSPGLFLGFELQPADVFTSQANALARSHQRTVCVTLGSLGAHDSLPGSDDAGVHLSATHAAAVAKRALQ